VQIAGPPQPATLSGSKLARRNRIVQAALRALKNCDYETAKITEIAADSGVALGTLYRYFASKEHLFAEAYVQWQDAMRQKYGQLPPSGDTEAERVRTVFRQVVHAFELQPQYFGVLVMLLASDDAHVAQVLRTSITSSFHDIVQSAFIGDTDAEHEAIFMTVNAVLHQSLSAWLKGRLAIDQVYAHVDQCIELIYTFQPDH
jgi:AcrR family transcriptional regulator